MLKTVPSRRPLLNWAGKPFFEKNKKPENHNITVEKKPQEILAERKVVKTQERQKLLPGRQT